MIGYIYQIINNENQKVYVGKTINFTQPFKEDENEIKSMLEFPTDINILKSGCTLNKLYENLFIEIKVKYDFDLHKFVYYLPSWLVDKDNLNQMHFNLYELKIADESNVGVIKKKNQTNEEDTEENITRTV